MIEYGSLVDKMLSIMEGEAEKHFADLKYPKDSIVWSFRSYSYDGWLLPARALAGFKDEMFHDIGAKFVEWHNETWGLFYKFLERYGDTDVYEDKEEWEEFFKNLPLFNPSKLDA